jgi:hypothetical protein
MIKRSLQWALSKFEDKPAEVKKPKTAVKKTATRKAVAKKATKVVKKAK